MGIRQPEHNEAGYCINAIDTSYEKPPIRELCSCFVCDITLLSATFHSVEVQLRHSITDSGLVTAEQVEGETIDAIGITCQELSDLLLLKTYHTVWYDLDNECDRT